MKIIRYNENLLDACAEFWWSIYKDMPYVHRPDGYQTINTPPIGPNPEYFVKYLKDGLSGHWCGKVTDDSIVLAVDGEKVEGILINSIDREKLTGNILSAYMRRDEQGREIADCLLSEALECFRKMGLHRAVAGPDDSKSLEVECPIHLAILDAGFGWEDNWEQPPDESGRGFVYDWPAYSVLLGGTLQEFRLQPEIKEKLEKLRKEGIIIERLTADEFRERRRFDNNQVPCLNPYTGETFAAIVDGRVVGWLDEMGQEEDEFGRILGGAIPEVIPSYRKKGIGKVLYHLGIEEVVQQGAQYGYTGTSIYCPARLIYRSVGFRYWYTSFCLMSKQLR